MHDQASHNLIEALVREHGSNPQAPDHILVVAARRGTAGYRDDASTTVIS